MLGAAIAILAVGASAGVSVAFFSASGSGDGSDVAATMQPVTVSALLGGDTPASRLQPGGAGDVILRVTNPNAYTVTLVSVSGNGPITASGGIGACTTPGVTFTDATGLSTTIGASGTTLVTLTGAAQMSTSSSSGCQGATFFVPVSIEVRR